VEQPPALDRPLEPRSWMPLRGHSPPGGPDGRGNPTAAGRSPSPAGWGGYSAGEVAGAALPPPPPGASWSGAGGECHRCRRVNTLRISEGEPGSRDSQRAVVLIEAGVLLYGPRRGGGRTGPNTACAQGLTALITDLSLPFMPPNGGPRDATPRHRLCLTARVLGVLARNLYQKLRRRIALSRAELGERAERSR
jgi:hypothetical protein